WRDRVRDGEEVLARDEAAWQRRTQARALEPVLTGAGESVDCSTRLADLGVDVHGMVGVAADYGEAAVGLHVTVGIDGRELCTLDVDHPVRGRGRIDVRGLTANRDWTGIGDPAQQAALGKLTGDALWRCVERIADRPALALAEGRHVLIDALAGLVAGEERPALRARLEALPLFGTVDERTASLADLRAEVERAGTLAAVDDTAELGRPGDRRLIVRIGTSGLAALAALFGTRLRRVDERWRAEATGARSFHEAPVREPELEWPTVSTLSFQTPTTHGVVGLLMPRDAPGGGDDADRDSRIRLHVGGRHIASHTPSWHPALEAWVNDDRLAPTADYRDVARDATYREVLALVEAQVAELCARAAEQRGGLDGRLQLRLCRLVLDRRDLLTVAAAAAPRGTEARLLAARLWPCDSAEGESLRSTAEVLNAQRDGRLALADPEVAEGEPAAGQLVLLAGADLRTVLARGGLTGLPDLTSELRGSMLHRRFLARAARARLDLDAVGERHLIARAPLTGDGWSGEVGVDVHPRQDITAYVHVDGRPLAEHTIESALGAVAIAQWSGLHVDAAWQAPVADAALASFEQHLRRAAWKLYAGLAAAPSATALPLLIAALHAAEQETEKDPEHAALLAALRAAPLFEDTHGRSHTLLEVREQADAAPVRTITRDTFDGNQWPTPDLVLVIDEAVWPAASALVALEQHDGRWRVECARALNRELAPDHHELPRGRLAEAEVDAGDLRGVLALSDDGDGPVGKLGLLSEGRRVEVRAFPELRGLVGWIDGPLATDDLFKAVALTPAQQRELERLYDERLAGAVELAHEHRRRRGDTWRALGRYVRLYLYRHVDALGGSFRQRRDHVLAPPEALPAPLRRALACPVFQTGDGDWVALAALLAAEVPRIAIGEGRERGLPEGTVVVRAAGDELPALLAALIGGAGVSTAGELRRQAIEEREHAEERAHKEREARVAGARGRAEAAWRALLREIAPSGQGAPTPGQIRHLDLPA
ncbi:MAG TPA: hypothetical protein VL172_06775, partial [Kofleriaceae bacterium]|nr:hypothetical protein [Kofleriaceae bacterium]